MNAVDTKQVTIDFQVQYSHSSPTDATDAFIQAAESLSSDKFSTGVERYSITQVEMDRFETVIDGKFQIPADKYTHKAIADYAASLKVALMFRCSADEPLITCRVPERADVIHS